MKVQCTHTCVVSVDLLLHTFQQHRVIKKLEVILLDVVLWPQQGLMYTVGGQVTKLLRLKHSRNLAYAVAGVHASGQSSF